MKDKKEIKGFIATTLKSHRVRSGLTQRDVGRMTGKAPQTVASWESAKGQPDIDTFIYLCYIYGILDILKEFGYKKNVYASTTAERAALSDNLRSYNSANTDIIEDEQLLLIQFRKMRQQDKKVALSMMGTLLKNRDEETEN